ncbi:MAG: hypothetical protein RLN92_18940, partial [Alloalcanivorax xenomutans]
KVMIWARIKPQNSVLRARKSKLVTVLPCLATGEKCDSPGEGRGYPLILAREVYGEGYPVSTG